MIKINKESFKKGLFASLSVNFELFLILAYWEILLYIDLHNGLSGLGIYNILFLLPISTVLCFLCGWIKSENSYKLNEIFKIIVIFIISIFYIADLIYFHTFGSLVSVSILGNGANAITNFWWSIVQTIKENIFTILFFEIPVIVEIILIFIRKQRNNTYSVLNHFLMIPIGIILWFIVVLLLPIGGTQDYTAYGAYHSSFINADSASAKIGALPNFIVEIKCAVLGTSDSTSYNETQDVSMEEEEEETEKVTLYNEYEGLDFNQLKQLSDNTTIQNLCTYLDTVEPTKQNEYTGLLEGYNLIYICAESFSSMAIDKTVTPTLYKMAHNGIVLNNYYNAFANVTTNGEYALLTGLWPNVTREDTNMGSLTGTMASSINKNMSTALGNMFNTSEGINSKGYHNYYGYYYGRNKSLPNMGFTCKFKDEGMTFTTSWPASDLEMMEQSIDDYINEDQFCAYYMTFSGHGNYTTDNAIVLKNYDTVSSMVDENLPDNAKGYLSGNYELEKAMEYLLQRLEAAGKLDNTLIVLTGDHYPYYLNEESYTALTGKTLDYSFGKYKSTCIMYTTGLESNIYVDEPCCNVDILPTVYNLFGIDYDSRLYAGSDIFSDSEHIAQLYNMNFITDYVEYNYSSGKATWLIDTENYDQEILDAYLQNCINLVKNKYMMSLEIEDTDFYKFVFENYTIH